MSVTHIAGNVITIGLRKIQRCPVRGEKLVDNIDELNGRIASPDGDVTTSFWPVAELVQIEGNRSSVLQHVDGNNLPDDSCINLVEE